MRDQIKTEDLYTVADVKRVREELEKYQGGIDPILKEPFKETTCLDHDHLSQKVRGVLGRNSNAFEGKVQRGFLRCLKWQTDLTLPQILRNMAEYLEQDFSNNPHHPAWIKRVQIDFAKLSASRQIDVLNSLSKINATYKNKREREEAFKKIILERKYKFVDIVEVLNGKTIQTHN